MSAARHAGALSASTFCSTAFKLTGRRAKRRDPAQTRRLRASVFAVGGTGAVGAVLRRFMFREPGAELRANEIGQRAVEQLFAGMADVASKCLVDVNDAPEAIRDGDQMRDRIEGILQLTPG